MFPVSSDEGIHERSALPQQASPLAARPLSLDISRWHDRQQGTDMPLALRDIQQELPNGGGVQISHGGEPRGGARRERVI